MRVAQADTDSDLAHARALFREYADSLPCSAQCSLQHQGFDDELASLPGKYASPHGCILLAVDDAPRAEHAPNPLGVVALRPLDPASLRVGDPAPACEMKRMYVRPAARGRGVGRALCNELLAFARAAGYRMMKLDTEPDLAHAVSLYRSVGFVDIPRYNEDPVSCTLWMGLVL
jgi:ribosomal protein S18 acetylase RimI-like enzyme